MPTMTYEAASGDSREIEPLPELLHQICRQFAEVVDYRKVT
jgi:hypothetical protein